MSTDKLLSPYSAYTEKGEIRLRVPAADERGMRICEHVISRETALALIADLQRCFAFTPERPHDCRLHRTMSGECIVCGSSVLPNAQDEPRR